MASLVDGKIIQYCSAPVYKILIEEAICSSILSDASEDYFDGDRR